MSQAKICVQAMMIKEDLARDGIDTVFKKLASMGFRGIELSQVPMDPDSIEKMADASRAYGIQIPAISAILESPADSNAESLTKDFSAFVQKCKELKAEYIRMGSLPLYYLQSQERLMEFCEKAEEYANRLKEHGISLYFHNHHAEFQMRDGMTAHQFILKNAPSLGMEVDVHWVWRGGFDPVDVIKQCGGKVDLLHLKDYRIRNLTSEIYNDQEANNGYFGSCVQFAEVGEGSLNMKDIIETGISCGSKYLIIEQDDTYHRTPMESLSISGNNLRKMGYGGLF